MKDFILPDIGEGIVECELLKWLVKEGETIKEDQAVAEVMTDKATVEIPAMHDGIVLKLYHQEGDIAKVHEPLFAMSDDTSDTQQVNLADKTKNNSSAEQNTHSSNTSNDVTGNVEAFILPDIGEGIVECEIMQWHVGEGDEVKEDQVVVEVMTDKAVVEIPAKFDGRIIKLHYEKGDIAAVHTPLFDQIIVGGSAQSLNQTSLNKNADAVLKKAAATNSEQNVQSALQSSYKQGENFTPPKEVARALASPAVRRLARDKGISLDNIIPTGPKGRVLKQDVMSALSGNGNTTQKQENTRQQTLSSQNTNSVSHQDAAEYKVEQTVRESQKQDRVEAIKGIRAAMAKQMLASVSTIPHFSVSDELCMDNLILLRTKLKNEFEAKGVKLSFMPFFIKALSLAMQSFPIVNSRLNNDATELTYLASHNIGLAVDSKIGLLVPNIKNVQDLSLFEVAEEVNRLIERAREGKLENTDLSGGTISISNIGAIGGITATPVINKPDVAIVALGKTQKLPRFTEQGEVFATNIMMVNWSGDHRVIDGATMVKFNNLWMDYLSNPEKMLVHLR